MSVSETWLLPDGVVDVLPQQAQNLERLRRHLLDTLTSRGYQLVFPPLIEYVESLLTHRNKDLDLITFKLLDQNSGRLMGVRADITPQVARIDAHVQPIEGIARYCYASTVLQAQAVGLSYSRAPVQVGAELYGCAGVEADIEVIDTMLTVLNASGFTEGLHLDLGNVQLFKACAVMASLTDAEEEILSDLYQRKAMPELRAYCQQIAYGADFLALCQYGSDLEGLKTRLSRDCLENSAFKYAFEALQQAQQHLSLHWANVNVVTDAGELRGYGYHTGLVFAVYGPNRPTPIAKGGRYDGIGEAFGRSRPATGFSCDLHDLAKQYALTQTVSAVNVIIAPCGYEDSLLSAISALRATGAIVIQAFEFQSVATVAQQARFTHQLIKSQDVWQVIAL